LRQRGRGFAAADGEEGDATVVRGGGVGKRATSNREERAGVVLMAIRVMRLR
jgi:hypothetical protein